MKATPQITIKTADELKTLREAGKILSSIIKDLQCSLKAGMSTAAVDAMTEKLIAGRGVKPAFKGYRGFPACACVSVNEEVVHGIPGKRVIREGDIVSVDVGIIHEGYYSDTAVTIPIGRVAPELERLMEVTRKALCEGIAQARDGKHLSDISHAVQSFVEAQKLSVVRDFVGHGIGRNLHEDPEIPNFGPPGCGPVLKAGMVLAIEPMVNLGAWQTRVTEDGWTVVTADGRPSAHFEHCVAVTNDGPEILTE